MCWAVRRRRRRRQPTAPRAAQTQCTACLRPYLGEDDHGRGLALVRVAARTHHVHCNAGVHQRMGAVVCLCALGGRAVGRGLGLGLRVKQRGQVACSMERPARRTACQTATFLGLTAAQHICMRGFMSWPARGWARTAHVLGGAHV